VDEPSSLANPFRSGAEGEVANFLVHLTLLPWMLLAIFTIRNRLLFNLNLQNFNHRAYLWHP
jgi:hypothetical protein